MLSVAIGMSVGKFIRYLPDRVQTPRQSFIVNLVQLPDEACHLFFGTVTATFRVELFPDALVQLTTIV